MSLFALPLPAIDRSQIPYVGCFFKKRSQKNDEVMYPRSQEVIRRLEIRPFFGLLFGGSG